jgi:hypothetical protein
LMDMKTLKLGKSKFRHPDSNNGTDVVPDSTHAAVLYTHISIFCLHVF